MAEPPHDPDSHEETRRLCQLMRLEQSDLYQVIKHSRTKIAASYAVLGRADEQIRILDPTEPEVPRS